MGNVYSLMLGELIIIINVAITIDNHIKGELLSLSSITTLIALIIGILFTIGHTMAVSENLGN